MFLVAFLLLFTLFLILSAKANNPRIHEGYSDLIKNIYENNIELENLIFKDLVFTLSDFQIHSGGSLKLVLEDQLNRKWLFKFQEGKQAGEIVIYRLFKLFGLNTPEVHIKTLNINGKRVQGSMQRFIKNQGTLERVDPAMLPENCLDYLLKTHVLDYLLGNVDAGPSNFLVVGDDKIEEIIRIDNEILFGFDEEESRIIEDHDDSYRRRLWEDYISGKISLRLKENYEFVRYIADFFDDHFKENFMLLGKEDDVTDEIIKIKHNLPAIFKKFYQDLLKKKKEDMEFPDAVNYKKITERTYEKLNTEIPKLKEDHDRLSKNSRQQQKIGAIVSPEAYFLVDRVYREDYIGHPENVENEFHMSTDDLYCEVLEKLNKLYSSSKNEYERVAIGKYIDEFLKLKNGGTPSITHFRIIELFDVRPQKYLRRKKSNGQ